MDDRDFFDKLYQGWAKTTGAGDGFWMPEESDEQYPAGGPGTWNIVALDSEQARTTVAEWLTEDDAAFITAVHGCFADLVRRLHRAVDESDRFDELKDDAVAEVAKAYLEIQDLEQQVAYLREVTER